MAICASFASAKHSPGATTACLAIAVGMARPDSTGRPTRRFIRTRQGVPASADNAPVLVVEADPAGGDLAARLERKATGLETLAPAARHVVDATVLMAHTQSLREHLQLLAAPASEAQATAALRALADRLAAHLASAPTSVLVDLGRLSPRSPALPLAAASRVVVWVARPGPEGVAHLKDRLRAIEAAVPEVVERSRLVVVDAGPYGADDFARMVGLPLLGTLAFDVQGVDVLYGRDQGRGTELMKDARSLARALRGDDEHDVRRSADDLSAADGLTGDGGRRIVG